MKFLFDLFPVILFFVAFKFSDIFVATGVAMAAAIAQIAYVVVRHGKVTPLQWASVGIIVVFGGATLLLQDETFIKWKPTVLYGLMGLSFLGSLAFGKNLIKAMMAENLELPEPVWFKLCIAWGVFFLFKAALNLWVAYNFSTETWVTFKAFGSTSLIVVFIIAQAFWISRYLPDDPPVPPAEKAP